jgi:hypothetical protein
MNRMFVLRLRWIVGLALPAIIALLTVRLASLPAVGGAQSLADQAVALVACLLPANPVSRPLAPPAASVDAPPPECEPTGAHPRQTVWISAC